MGFHGKLGGGKQSVDFRVLWWRVRREIILGEEHLTECLNRLYDSVKKIVPGTGKPFSQFGDHICRGVSFPGFDHQRITSG